MNSPPLKPHCCFRSPARISAGQKWLCITVLYIAVINQYKVRTMPQAGTGFIIRRLHEMEPRNQNLQNLKGASGLFCNNFPNVLIFPPVQAVLHGRCRRQTLDRTVGKNHNLIRYGKFYAAGEEPEPASHASAPQSIPFESFYRITLSSRTLCTIL